MDLTEKDCVEKALAYHRKGYNCSQAVACTFCELMGLDESVVFQMMEGFGFGVSDSYGTCGAVTGMAAVAGKLLSTAHLDTPDSKQNTYAKVRELNNTFRQKNGSTICRDLKGMDTGEVLRSCDGCIEDAVRILCKEFLK